MGICWGLEWECVVVTNLGLNHVVPLVSHAKHKVKYVHLAHLSEHVHHSLDADESARAADTSTGGGGVAVGVEGVLHWGSGSWGGVALGEWQL